MPDCDAGKRNRVFLRKTPSSLSCFSLGCVLPLLVSAGTSNTKAVPEKRRKKN
jgi:hypothetical protein